MTNDRQLAQGIAAGDRKAFEQFVDCYGSHVHRLAARYATDSTDAEDLTQEIFVELYRAIGSFRGDSALSTWVYRVAMNRCLKHQGRSHTTTTLANEHEEIPDHNDPAQQTLRSELGNEVRCAVDALSPLHRDVVILHELHGLSYDECARVLGIPVGTVKSRLSNAFRRLRATLGDYVLGENSLLPDAVGEVS